MQDQPLDVAPPGSWPATVPDPVPHPPVVDASGYVAVHLIAVPLALAALAWQFQYGTLDMVTSRLVASIRRRTISSGAARPGSTSSATRRRAACP